MYIVFTAWEVAGDAISSRANPDTVSLNVFEMSSNFGGFDLV
jgi:hypothetical protein